MNLSLPERGQTTYLSPLLEWRREIGEQIVGRLGAPTRHIDRYGYEPAN